MNTHPSDEGSNADSSPYYQRDDLSAFHTANPDAQFYKTGDVEYLTGLWGTSKLRISMPELGGDAPSLLNNIAVDSRFDAIIHTDTAVVEFLFSFLDPADDDDAPVIDRRFTVHFHGHDFSCYYAQPTDRVLAIAKASSRLPSDGTDQPAPQLRQFCDFQRSDKMGDHVRRYFQGKVPRNFFVSLSANPSVDLQLLSRHINLLAAYYDRRSPQIVIHQSSTEPSTRGKPIRFIASAMPEILNAREVDDVVLTLLEVARVSQPRSSFLYY